MWHPCWCCQLKATSPCVTVYTEWPFICLVLLFNSPISLLLDWANLLLRKGNKSTKHKLKRSYELQQNLNKYKSQQVSHIMFSHYAVFLPIDRCMGNKLHASVNLYQERIFSVLLNYHSNFLLSYLDTNSMWRERERESSIETYEATLSWDPALEKGAMDLLSACHWNKEF